MAVAVFAFTIVVTVFFLEPPVYSSDAATWPGFVDHVRLAWLATRLGPYDGEQRHHPGSRSSSDSRRTSDGTRTSADPRPARIAAPTRSGSRRRGRPRSNCTVVTAAIRSHQFCDAPDPGAE
jgi:hypothetical protein